MRFNEYGIIKMSSICSYKNAHKTLEFNTTKIRFLFQEYRILYNLFSLILYKMKFVLPLTN